MLLIGPLGTKFSEIIIEIHTFLFDKMHLQNIFWKTVTTLSRPQYVNIIMFNISISNRVPIAFYSTFVSIKTVAQDSIIFRYDHKPLYCSTAYIDIWIYQRDMWGKYEPYTWAMHMHFYPCIRVPKSVSNIVLLFNLAVCLVPDSRSFQISTWESSPPSTSMDIVHFRGKYSQTTTVWA